MRPMERGRGLIVAIGLVVALAIGARMFDIGLIQGRFDVGAPTWVEGSFGWLYLLFFGLVSLIALGFVAVVRGGDPGPLRRGLRDALVLGIVALWLGFGVGWATAWVQGPPLVRQGTVVYELGPPVSTSLRSVGTCASVVGDADLIAEFRPDDTDLPTVWIRGPVHRNEYPTIVPIDGSRSFLVPDGVPTWIGGYDWSLGSVQEGTDGGTMRVTGSRHMDGTGPGSLDVLVTWRCSAVPPLE